MTKKHSDKLELPAITTEILPAIVNLTTALGIPREVLADDEEIQQAWLNLPRELRLIPPQQINELIARMCVAASVGLFDSAMNFIWNASILHLRDKVRGFGLSAVRQVVSKTDFEEKHLVALQDSALLELCLKLNLIAEEGYFFLDQCRNVRNKFSAAHPTLGRVNDREFILFLNRCIKYALVGSSSPTGVDIQSFISAVKGSRFTDGQCDVWVNRLRETHEAQRRTLIGMIHGIYCDPSTAQPARLNVLDLCNVLKNEFSSDTQSDLINRHSDYLAKGNAGSHAASLQFFEKLDLVSLLNESEQHSLFAKALTRLWNVHLAMNNFYNEPPFAERVLDLSKNNETPETIQEQFVQVIVCCYIGNGYGVSWDAEAKYKTMIEDFSPREIAIMIRLRSEDGILKERISQDPSCMSRFREAVALIDSASVPSGSKTEYSSILS